MIPKWVLLAWITSLLGALLLATGCSKPLMPAAAPSPSELTLYNWAEYMPQTVLDAFTVEYGVKINYLAYANAEEAVANIRNGEIYDIVVLAPEFIPALLEEDRLAPIDYENVPNFRNISPSFRDLVYDPGNRYSIPFHWGTTGLLVRTDLVAAPVTRWADLWDPQYAGRISLWPISRSLIPISLKSLGYSANSVNPVELAAAVRHLEQLKPNVTWWDPKSATIVPALIEGDSVIAFGWAYDAFVAREQAVPISYILPEEGTFLWSDNFVIPANSPHKSLAELFFNFVLRPEISAQIVNESYYAMANDAAVPLIAPEILADPVVYPPDEFFRNAEVILPLDATGENMYSALWRQFWDSITVP